MIINFSRELQNIINHSSDLFNRYDLTISGDTNYIPKEHHSITILFDEDVDKIRAICAAADELDKKNKELEKLVKESGLEDHNSFYYPLGGGSLF